MASHIARFGRGGTARYVAYTLTSRVSIRLEVVGSHQNSALLAAHRRWVARSR